VGRRGLMAEINITEQEKKDFELLKAGKIQKVWSYVRGVHSNPDVLAAHLEFKKYANNLGFNTFRHAEADSTVRIYAVKSGDKPDYNAELRRLWPNFKELYKNRAATSTAINILSYGRDKSPLFTSAFDGEEGKHVISDRKPATEKQIKQLEYILDKRKFSEGNFYKFIEYVKDFE